MGIQRTLFALLIPLFLLASTTTSTQEVKSPESKSPSRSEYYEAALRRNMKETVLEAFDEDDDDKFSLDEFLKMKDLGADFHAVEEETDEERISRLKKEFEEQDRDDDGLITVDVIVEEIVEWGKKRDAEKERTANNDEEVEDSEEEDSADEAEESEEREIDS